MNNKNVTVTGRIGESLAKGDLRDFYQAHQYGTSKVDPPLSYQDMADFQEFSSQFRLLGVFDGAVVIAHHSGSTFGRKSGKFEDIAVFEPVNLKVEFI